ncbi:MAG: hypothetical protein GSR86_04425 [Desulfurococcales archaeon]|nr:hypothetical protein [Desulfurococcales archaeon]
MDVYLEWAEGYVRLGHDRRGLTVSGRNFTLALGLREIVFKGPFEGVDEVLQDRRGSSKVVYIRTAFPLKGYNEPRGTVYRASRDFSVGVYGVAYTRIEGVGVYITVHPPVGSLYKSITISDDVVAVYTLGRRQVYLMEEDGERRIILV